MSARPGVPDSTTILPIATSRTGRPRSTGTAGANRSPIPIEPDARRVRPAGLGGRLDEPAGGSPRRRRGLGRHDAGAVRSQARLARERAAVADRIADAGPRASTA